jgi:hypothetical protein
MNHGYDGFSYYTMKLAKVLQLRVKKVDDEVDWAVVVRKLLPVPDEGFIAKAEGQAMRGPSKKERKYEMRLVVNAAKAAGTFSDGGGEDDEDDDNLGFANLLYADPESPSKLPTSLLP